MGLSIRFSLCSRFGQPIRYAISDNINLDWFHHPGNNPNREGRLTASFWSIPAKSDNNLRLELYLYKLGDLKAGLHVKWV